MRQNTNITSITMPLITAMIMSLLMTHRAAAMHKPLENLSDYPLDELIQAENGTVEHVTLDGQAVWRWHPNNGQTSTLSIRPDHPLFDRLRYYDRLQFEYRIAAGQISGIKFNAVGHVSGPRQYKVHNHRIAIVTTPVKVWHDTQLDLYDAYWFPWDRPDGEGEEGYFRFEALAIAPDTVIELRQVKLVRALLLLKPDYQRPVTWPTKQVNPDGSVTYRLTHYVVNTSGQPTDITARVISKHEHFKVALVDGEGDAAKLVSEVTKPTKAAAVATFELQATISAADIKNTPELYHEPIELRFSPSSHPDVSVLWQGHAVRPLSSSVRRQVVVTEDDLKLLREKYQAHDEAFLKEMGISEHIARGDEFVGKVLQSIPRAYNHVRNGYPQPWVPGNIMPEAVNTETGERRIGDHIAGAVWREYLGYSGQAPEHDGMAYIVTQDEKYARKAIELMRIFAMQYQYRPWYALFDVPYYQGTPIQSSAHNASNSSYGSNWDFKWFSLMTSLVADSPSWTPEDREFIYRDFIQPYAAELAKLPAQISNQADITNHNMLLMGLAFDDATMVWMATLRDFGVVQRLSDIDKDGFSSEGRPLNYHHAAASEYLPSVTHLVNSNLKLDFGLDRVLEAIRMPYQRAALNGLVPNSGDSGRGQRVGSSFLADVVIGIAPDPTWLDDIGQGSTLAAKLYRYRHPRERDPNRWMQQLSSKPRLFGPAGLAILRSGDSVDSQIMATLDYGRSVFHGALDRNQFTLIAFGKIFTHGTGSLYNAGSGGIMHNPDQRFATFNDGRVSIAHNVVVVNEQAQINSVGELLAWSAEPDYQVAVSKVDGIAHGVSHTRGLVLTHGVILMIDRVQGESENTYDLAYHNFGDLSLPEGWKAAPLSKPLATTGNYENIVDPAKLTGSGMLQLTWDLTNQIHFSQRDKGETGEPMHLALWRLPIEGSTCYIGKTGANNTNTGIMSDEMPTLIHRVHGREATYYTVLEPYKTQSQVTQVRLADGGRLEVTFKDGKTVGASLDQLIKDHKVK